MLSSLIGFICLHLQQDLVSILFQDGSFSLFVSSHTSYYVVDVKLNMFLNSLVGERQSYFSSFQETLLLIENLTNESPILQEMLSNDTFSSWAWGEECLCISWIVATGYSLKDTESAGLGGIKEICLNSLTLDFNYDLGRQDYESTFSLYNHSIYNRPLKCVFFFFWLTHVQHVGSQLLGRG